MVEYVFVFAMVLSLICAGAAGILLLETLSFKWPACHSIRKRNVVIPLALCYGINNVFVLGFHLALSRGSIYTADTLQFWVVYSSAYMILFYMVANLHMAYKIIRERRKTADVIREKLESRRRR